MKVTHSLLQKSDRPSLLRRILRDLSAICVLALALAANGAERRPPLQGGVEHWEPERPQPPGRPPPRQALCEGYAASVAQLSGRIQVMPKAGGGPGPLPQGRPIEEYCLAPNPNWTLLGEDRNYCCFFAPSEWTPKFPPLPGNIQKNQEVPNRRPTKDDPKRDPTYDQKARRDGPLPWELPAEAQTTRRIVGTASARVTWNSPSNENRDHRQREGACSFSIEFYSDGMALVRSYQYLNDDYYQIMSGRTEREHIYGGPSSFPFRSDLNISPKGNNLYDISWTNPTLDSTRDYYYRLHYPDAQWQPKATDGSPAYNAYCVGRSAGQVGNRPAVSVRLISVGLVDSLLPTSPRTNTSTIVLANLQKQVSKASVTMHWNFQQPSSTQRNIPQAQPRR